MNDQQQYFQLQQAIVEAASSKSPVQFIAGGSKAFYGESAVGKRLSIRDNQGIVNYQPSELVITVKAGTTLTELESLLASKQQILGFEPPHFASTATVGGAIATGLSGPRRAFAGAARDFVLGCKIINGKGEILSFGGEVMKNVAGYDVSRLMVGAMGTLGLILEVSLKVLPSAKNERTFCYPLSAELALLTMSQWRRQYLPITAMGFDGKELLVRLSGTEVVVQSAIKKMGDRCQVRDNQFWYDFKEQRLPFFQTPENIWRISVPPATPVLNIQGQWLYDWGGALRWLKTDLAPEQIFDIVRQVNGHAMLFRGYRSSFMAQSLAERIRVINKNIKQTFDPFNILNRQRRAWDKCKHG